MKKIYTTCILLLLSYFSFSQWNLNTAENLEIAALNVADLQTAKTTDGKTWIAFYNNNAGNYDMRAQLLDVAGNKLLGPDGVLVSNQTSGSATFVFNVCLDASNNLIIGFQGEKGGVSTAVVTKVNIDGSLPWTGDGVELGPGLAPYPVVLTTGETAVGWNNSSPSTLYLQKVSAAGSLVWGAPVVVTVGVTNTTRGQLVANTNGYFTMVFQKKSYGISSTPYAQRYNSDGVAQWAAPVQISTRTTSAARYYSVIADGDITYFGYYASGGSRFYSNVQKINADGSIPWGANGSSFSTYGAGTEPSQQNTNIAITAGSPYLWAVSTYSNSAQTQYGVYVQKFDVATGAVLLDPLGKEVYPISSNYDTQTGQLVLLNDNPIFMSYDVNYKIYVTRLTSSGDFAWNPIRTEISSTTASLATPKGRFAFTNIFNNQVVGVWYENRGTEYRAYAQNISSSGVLPVSLVDFRAIRTGKTAGLFWNTASENNSKGFNIEKSADGITYQLLDFVATKAAGGNSSNGLNYFYEDKKPLMSANYYRIKLLDLDDKFSYSKTALVRFNTSGSFFINNVYPKPALSTLHVAMEAGKITNGSLLITDLSGKVFTQKSLVLNKGNNLVTLDVSSLAKGIYVLKIISNENEIAVEKWIKE